MKSLFKKNKDAGYILLFSMVISSILLSVVLGIYTASFRQRIFTQEANNSDKVFYAADSILDCLSAYDFRGAFPDAGGSSADIICNGGTINTTVGWDDTPNGAVYEYETFEIATDPSQKICGSVIIQKRIVTNNSNPNNGNPLYDNKFSATAYNLTCADLQQHFQKINNAQPSNYDTYLISRSVSFVYESE